MKNIAYFESVGQLKELLSTLYDAMPVYVGGADGCVMYDDEVGVVCFDVAEYADEAMNKDYEDPYIDF